MNSAQMLTFPVPLSQKMRDTATKFSQSHQNASKARQVYLNTLAVLAVEFYCQCMEIETQLGKSHSWNTTLMDLATLEIQDIGKIECRPVLKGKKSCYFPPEVWQDRIGYLVIEIDEQANKARLLGYLRVVNSEQISLNQLQSLSDFLTNIEEILIPAAASVAVTTGELITNVVKTVGKTVIELGKWFEGIFDHEWKPEEKALTLSIQPSRTIKPINEEIEQPEVNGAKVICLGMETFQQTVVLIIGQKKINAGEIEINLRLYPSANTNYLPDEIKLTVLDEAGNPIPSLEAQAKSHNWLQLQFTGEPRDKFSVKVSLGESSITENFLL